MIQLESISIFNRPAFLCQVALRRSSGVFGLPEYLSFEDRVDVDPSTLVTLNDWEAAIPPEAHAEGKSSDLVMQEGVEVVHQIIEKSVPMNSSPPTNGNTLTQNAFGDSQGPYFAGRISWQRVSRPRAQLTAMPGPRV